MPPRLPALARLPLSSEPGAFVTELSALVERSDASHGFVRADVPERTLLLFVRDRKTYCAGALEEDRPTPISVARFLQGLPRARSVQFHVTDLALFLCAAVLVRKAPAAQIPARLLDGATLLSHLEETGKDAVLVIKRGDARSLVFCREGTPVRLYPAEDEELPREDTPADTIIAYAHADPARSVSIDVYDEIQLAAARDAGQPVAELAPRQEPAPSRGEPAVLAVKLGDRIVFHFPIDADEISIGRGLDNDLELDNPSVSRKHAVLRPTGKTLVLDDLGSQNGLVQNGRRHGRVELYPGQEVAVGKYTLLYLRYAPAVLTPPRRTGTPLSAAEQTFSLRPGGPPMLVTARGEKLPIRGLDFTIGRDEKADLRLRGRWIEPVHARIVREPSGHYTLRATGKGRGVKVNGEATLAATLESGDEIQIRSHKLRFLLPR